MTATSQLLTKRSSSEKRDLHGIQLKLANKAQDSVLIPEIATLEAIRATVLVA